MTCPICQKRKGNRFCPAKAETICSVCCATEREVTIDCPSDCSYLVASREHEAGRREVDWSKIPFAHVRIPPSAFAEHQGLLSGLAYAICRYAGENRALVDTDAIAALQSLAETYQTLSSGLYYEQPPGYRIQRELYETLKAAIEDYRKAAAQQMGLRSVRDNTIRDALIFCAQLGATRTNGRSNGRAYLDFLRSQFGPAEFARPVSNIVLP